MGQDGEGRAVVAPGGGLGRDPECAYGVAEPAHILDGLCRPAMARASLGGHRPFSVISVFPDWNLDSTGRSGYQWFSQKQV